MEPQAGVPQAKRSTKRPGLMRRMSSSLKSGIKDALNAPFQIDDAAVYTMLSSSPAIKKMLFIEREDVQVCMSVVEKTR
jgi:hypothetical protein